MRYANLVEARPRWSFIAVTTLLFAAGVGMTLVHHTSMSAMNGMPMPGGWTMSSMWMRVCGQTWIDVAASFAGMWIAMMTAMMLPIVAPTLWRYRAALDTTDKAHADRLTVCVGAAYFVVWTAFGMTVFPLGVALTMLDMHIPVLARAVPVASGIVVLVAGASQFTSWKMRRLACCSNTPGKRPLAANTGTAWRYGLSFGLHCVYCCAGPTAVLLVAGIMNLHAMTVVTVAIAAERLAPAGKRVARAIGAVAIGAGLFMIARSIGLG
ncbi:DUF2182 domain-containing protein [Paraburkholderia sp.]|uniref:DUF2182 domain-containing protein n=1 Tax=Paraburkholderia sp. TaxID=1926495 RepID=UPI003D6FB791